MRMSFRKCASIIVMVIFGFALMGAECEKQPEQTSKSGAEEAAPAVIRKNSEGRTTEQQNIYDRIKVTTDPTKVMWIHLIALDGKIVKRMAVRNKVTSSGKRLEPRHAATNPSNGSTPPRAGNYYTDEFIQPDGTYGESDSYIFWFDPMGRYHQWGTAGGLGYLLTDYPIDLENPIEKVTGMYNADRAAAEWQVRQEAKFKAEQGR